jgi:hypothetical protein
MRSSYDKCVSVAMTCLDCQYTLIGFISKQSACEIHSLGWGTSLEHTCPGYCTYLWEFKILIIWVHFVQFLLRGGSQHLPEIFNINPDINYRLYVTLIISTSWSTPELPGKIGHPMSSSATTHPADQTSIAGE